MIQTPSDIVNTNQTQTVPKCSDPLPANNYPMPRCISDIITNYRIDPLNVEKKISYRSRRQTSHLVIFIHSLSSSSFNHIFIYLLFSFLSRLLFLLNSLVLISPLQKAPIYQIQCIYHPMI